VATTHAPSPTKKRPPRTARRFGYVVAIALNVVMLWVVHQVLEWGWPGFLTARFVEVLPLLSASIVASIAVNVGLLAYDRGRFRALTDLVTAAFGLAVTLRFWNVFPFDFTGYDRDWTWLFRAGLVLGIVGTAIGALVAFTRIVGGLPSEEP
jgi:hypothetical protein